MKDIPNIRHNIKTIKKIKFDVKAKKIADGIPINKPINTGHFLPILSDTIPENIDPPKNIIIPGINTIIIWIIVYPKDSSNKGANAKNPPIMLFMRKMINELGKTFTNR